MAREYRLLDIPGAGEELDEYRAAVQHVRVGDLEYFWEDRWAEFEQSPEFQSLSDVDRALARFTIKCIAEEESSWRIQEDDDTDNLFEMASPRFVVPSTLDDAMILSGARGWEIAQELIDENHRNKKHLGHLALDGYVNLTVAAMIHGRNDNGESDLSYFITDTPDTVTRQTVGGTFHGDFAAGWKRFATNGPVYDPTGTLRNFAPAVAGDYVRAYHSVETKLAIGMLKYLSAGDYTRLEETKQMLVDAIDAANLGRGGGNFADFGTNAGGYEHEIFIDGFREYPPNYTIESFLVTPGNRDTRMELVAEEEGVSLKNLRTTTDDEGKVTTEELGTMHIPQEEIPMFIATMAAASAGRTSLDELRDTIARAEVWGSDNK
jgi:hypothetical protein